MLPVHPLNSALHRYWMHELLRCGVAVELLWVKEPQEVSQPGKARKSSAKQKVKSGSVLASAATKQTSVHLKDACSSIIIISSDDDVFEK